MTSLSLLKGCADNQKEACKGVSEPPVAMEDIVAIYLPLILRVIAVDDMRPGRKKVPQHIV